MFSPVRRGRVRSLLHSFILTDPIRLPGVAGNFFPASSYLKTAAEKGSRWWQSFVSQSWRWLQVFTFVNTQLTIHLKWAHFTPFYSNDVLFKKKKKKCEDEGRLAENKDRIPPLLR